MLFATSCNKGSAIYYWLCSKTLGATLWRLRRLRTIKAQCSPPLLHARRRVCCCPLVRVHAPVDYLLPILHGFARDAVYVRFFSMQILSPTSGTFRRRVCCCLPFGVHALSTCCAQDAVYVRFCSIQILFLRSGTFRKFIMKPQVTLSFPPVYCFQRYELTYLPAEIFLTDHSTPISKEIIVSHHTRAIITRS